MFRIFLAQQRASADAVVVAALLRAWLREPPPGEALREPSGLALERLVAATQLRFPVVSDLARGVVFAWFGQPLLRRNRARVYADVRNHLRYLDANPDAPDRAELDRRDGARHRAAGAAARSAARSAHDLDNTVMLEVLTRRYYGNKDLAGVRTTEVAGCRFVVAERVGSRIVVGRGAASTALGDALRGLAELAGDGDALDADIYLAWENQPGDSDAMAAVLSELINAQPLPDQVRRLTATVAGRGGAVMHQHFTFRPAATGMAEERLIRGLHPYIAQRMQLERLREVRPHPAAVLGRGRLPVPVRRPGRTRRTNASSRSSQVRDLTELRDHDGRLAALPTAEDTIAACLDSIRRAQSRRPARNRFSTNRIVIYIWPPSNLTRAELEMIASRVLPTTAGAGLEEILFIGR